MAAWHLITVLRQKFGLTQQQFEKLLGMAHATARRLEERPVGKIELKHMTVIAEALNVPPELFFLRAVPPILFTSTDGKLRVPGIDRVNLPDNSSLWFTWPGSLMMATRSIQWLPGPEKVALVKLEGESVLYILGGRVGFVYTDPQGEYTVQTGTESATCNVRFLTEGEGVYIAPTTLYGCYCPDESDEARILQVTREQPQVAKSEP